VLYINNELLLKQLMFLKITNQLNRALKNLANSDFFE